jgi:hypothetical protein
MSDTLLASLIGGSITGAVAIISAAMTSYFSLRKEREQGDRQRKLEDEKWNREKVAKQAERAQSIRANCLLYVSAAMQMQQGYSEDKLPETKKKCEIYHRRACKWLAALTVAESPPIPGLGAYIDAFMMMPYTHDSISNTVFTNLVTMLRKEKATRSQ